MKEAGDGDEGQDTQMRGRIRKLENLERRFRRSSTFELQGAWTSEAVRRLSDRELRILVGVLRHQRDAGLDDTEFSQLRLGPEEQAAFERFCGFYEEARRGA